MIHKADKELKEQWQEIFNQLPNDSKVALKSVLKRLRIDSLKKSEYSWRKHKAPMALYWKVVGVYSGHIARSINVDKASLKK